MYYDIAITQFTKMLGNLLNCIQKGEELAAAKKFDMEVLLNSRLAPDQFNFIRQIQITCDTAKLGASRLTGKEAPTHDDSEKSVADLKARIEATMTYLNKFKAEDFNEAATKHISQPRWEGKYLTGAEFFTQHMIPNFYFHMTTAYSILRHNGVEVGKKTYLGEMPYKK